MRKKKDEMGCVKETDKRIRSEGNLVYVSILDANNLIFCPVLQSGYPFVLSKK